MRVSTLSGAVALAVAAVAGSALADDPRDRSMNLAAIARDRETIRRMNLDQLDYVQHRDAQYAQEAQGYTAAWRDTRAARSDYAQRQDAYARELQRYREDRRRYDEAMTQWRQDVASCDENGDCGY
jgi:hypothetical protein